jgi:hypothetical protein
MEKVNGNKILPVANVIDGSPACATCPYFRLREDLQDNSQTRGAGECRRHPPKIFFNQVMSNQPTGRILADRTAETVPVLAYNMQMQSPLVKNDFFCGEHPEMRSQAEYEQADARFEIMAEKMPELAEILRHAMAGEASPISLNPDSKVN